MFVAVKTGYGAALGRSANDTRNGTMSNVRKRAMEAVLEAAGQDIEETFQENGIADRQSDEADEAVFDVAILYAYRVFVRICEQQGIPADVQLFAELSGDLADEMENDNDQQ